MFPDANVEGPDSIHWLYNTMSNLYGDWLPGEEQQQTIKDGGYYSVGYTSPFISLSPTYYIDCHFKWLTIVNFFKSSNQVFSTCLYLHIITLETEIINQLALYVFDYNEENKTGKPV